MVVVNVVLIDPTKYDNGSGTLQTVSASQWTIQRVFQGVVNIASTVTTELSRYPICYVYVLIINMYIFKFVDLL